MKKDSLIDSYNKIKKIECLFDEAYDLLNELEPEIQSAILEYHNERSSLQQCIRCGYHAAQDIRQDWHTVVSNILCEAYSYFDHYIVRGCKKADEEDLCIDIVADDEAEFYGVYLIKDDGLEEWVADYSIKKEAEDFTQKHNQKYHFHNES